MEVPIVMALHTRSLLRTRPISPAPKFCPANVVMAMPYAPEIIQKKPSILPKAVHAAAVSVPNELMPVWMMMLEMAYMFDCSPAGMPTASTARSACAEKRISDRITRYTRVVRIRAIIVSTRAEQLTHDGAQRRAQHAHVHTHHEHEVQHDVQRAGRGQKVQRALCVATARSTPAPTL